MKHTARKRPQADVLDVLREDPALKALYQCKTLAEVETKLGTLTAAQRTALLEGVAKVVWVLLRTGRGVTQADAQSTAADILGGLFSILQPRS